MPEGPLTKVPQGLRGLIEKATAMDPAQRFESAATLGRALAALEPSAATQADEAELPPDEQSWQKAVALIAAGSNALALHVVVVSLSPKVVESAYRRARNPVRLDHRPVLA